LEDKLIAKLIAKYSNVHQEYFGIGKNSSGLYFNKSEAFKKINSYEQ